MTKSSDASTNSATTGPVSLGTAVANAIGTARSGTQSAVLSPAAALGKLTPRETDARVAASLEHISGHRPLLKRRTLFPENGPAYSICEAASWRCENAEQQQDALRAVEYSLRPAGEDDLGAALYSLRVMTRGRERYEADDREAEAIVWLQQLSKYPADIALDVIRNWPTRSDGQWWPTWHDVQKELEGATNARRLLATHIRSGACLAKPTGIPERDDSPEAVAARREFVERQKAKLSQPDAAPVNIAEDFDAWEARTKAEIDAQNRKGGFKLSPAALATFDKSTPSQFPEQRENAA